MSDRHRAASGERVVFTRSSRYGVQLDPGKWAHVHQAAGCPALFYWPEYSVHKRESPPRVVSEPGGRHPLAVLVVDELVELVDDFLQAQRAPRTPS